MYTISEDWLSSQLLSVEEAACHTGVHSPVLQCPQDRSRQRSVLAGWSSYLQTTGSASCPSSYRQLT